jgi:phage protein D
METVIQPAFKLLYDGKDITEDVSRFLVDLVYTDHSEGESDELSVTLEDTDALWRGGWYPDKGAKLTLEYGYPDNLVLAGEFEIDEISMQGVPDTITIRGMAAVVSKQLRTKGSFAHENKTLRQIVEATAARNGLTVEGEIEQLRLQRVTQDRQTDLDFLKQLSYDYGYLFSIRGEKLIFTSIFDIEEGDPVKEIARRDLKSYSIRDRINFTYESCDVSYQNPLANLVFNSTREDDREQLGRDQLRIRTRVENRQQAEIISRVALYRANSKQQQGTLSLQGDPELVAGINIELIGLGQLSGIYNLGTSRHTISRGNGYVTDLEIKRVGLVDSVKQAATPERPESVGYDVEDF